MKKVEILAPAGSFDGMKAAIYAGCDAVYLGGSLFGARAFAENLTEEQLLEAIDYAHLRSKKLYLTVNTLLKEDELLGKLSAYLEKPYSHGLDAVIVQDFGVLKLIHERFPKLPIHASTQMSIMGAGSASLLKSFGVTRIVTARELNVDEIKRIAVETGLEIETFVHGALCYSYSGRCLMSSMIGGRSGNRGRCAQTCRMPYKAGGEECYPLSPKDIMTIPFIPELVEAGICSFKIEGRMKRIEYAAYTSAVYRKYLDKYELLGKTEYKRYLQEHGDEWEEDLRNLSDLYNRGGFSSGYLFHENGPKMMSMERPNHQGVLIGNVTEVREEREGSGKTAVKKKSVSIALTEEAHAGDILEICKNAEKIYDFTVKAGSKAGSSLSANVYMKSKVEKGMAVYRTKNESLLMKIQKEFLEPMDQVKITGRIKASVGEELELMIKAGEETVTVNGPKGNTATNQPVTKEQIQKQITKTGTSIFVFEELEVVADSSVFFPMGALKTMRREAFSELQEKMCMKYKRNLQSDAAFPVKPSEAAENGQNFADSRKENNGLSLIVGVTGEEQLNAILSYPNISVIQYDISDLSLPKLPDMIKKVQDSGKKMQIKLPFVLREQGRNRLMEAKARFSSGEAKEIDFIIENLEEYAFLTEDCGISPDHIVADFFLYTYNKKAKEFLRNLGITRFTASPELNEKELDCLGIMDSDIMIYGHIPLMISAQCLKKNTKTCTKTPDFLELSDRMNKTFYVKTHCLDCYNVLYNGEVLCLFSELQKIKKKKPAGIRLDFTLESGTKIKQVMDAYFMIGEEKTDNKIASYTKGHFKRGIE